jgi:hypothetical protein
MSPRVTMPSTRTAGVDGGRARVPEVQDGAAGDHPAVSSSRLGFGSPRAGALPGALSPLPALLTLPPLPP